MDAILCGTIDKPLFGICFKYENQERLNSGNRDVHKYRSGNRDVHKYINSYYQMALNNFYNTF